MANLYQLGATADAQTFNQNYYDVIVCQNTGTPQFPYDSSTTDYFPWQDFVFVVSDEAQAVANNSNFTTAQITFNEGYIATMLDEAQAIAAGWIPGAGP